MTTIIVDEPIHGKRKTATIELPEGWYRVLSGAVKPGDRSLNVISFWEHGVVEWRPLKEFPKPPRQPYSTAEWFSCLIRKGKPVETLCPRCLSAPTRFHRRYCRHCIWDLAEQRPDDE